MKPIMDIVVNGVPNAQWPSMMPVQRQRRQDHKRQLEQAELAYHDEVDAEDGDAECPKFSKWRHSRKGHQKLAYLLLGMRPQTFFGSTFKALFSIGFDLAKALSPWRRYSRRTLFSLS
jgi:hypothetical protein